MTNARRLSKLDMLVSFIKALRNLLPIIILISIKVKDWNGTKTLATLSILALVIIAIGITCYLEWRKFQYSLDQDRLIIHKGIFKREEKTIYYNRIHSVNVQQPLLLRIVGAASLQIETPGGQPGKAEGELRVLKHAYALELQGQLKQLRMVKPTQSDLAGQGAQQAHDAATGQDVAVVQGELLHRGAQSGTDTAVAQDGQVEQSVQDGQGEQLSHGQQHAVNSYNEKASHGAGAGVDGLVRNDGASVDQLAHGEQAGRAYDVYSSSGNLLDVTGQPNHEEPQYRYQLSFAQLLKASLTSLNLNFAFIFIFGIYSFADEVLDVISPGLYDRVFDQVIDQTSALPIVLLLLLSLLVIGGVWLLSVAIYLIKFGDYQITRSHMQLSVSYGLLEKKSYIFDQNKVQAVIMEENPLRQWLGFAELRVQVVTSNKLEQLVIHPFARKKEIPSIMKELLPDYTIELRKQLHAPPKRAFRNYALMPTIIGLLLVAGAVWLWQWSGVFLLLLLPIIWGWCLFRMKSSGVWLEDNDLTLRKRNINLITHFVRRKHIVTLSLKSSPMQRKRELHNIHVQVLGSMLSYSVKGIEDKVLLPIWSWYSRNGKRNSIEQ